uniref:Uncharacterized protein n=1 Tax=Pyxicephalus adspersus TaxID=30357 RepID=A0AAV3AA84_PYXAD|nr:TPA: hypothetical protein GDO54_014641 [Pyxicephalus adspersus]
MGHQMIPGLLEESMCNLTGRIVPEEEGGIGTEKGPKFTVNICALNLRPELGQLLLEGQSSSAGESLLSMMEFGGSCYTGSQLHASMMILSV